MKSDGADIEKVWCAAARYIQDSTVSVLLWNNRECGEGLTDVKGDGADIEKVWCAAA